MFNILSLSAALKLLNFKILKQTSPDYGRIKKEIVYQIDFWKQKHQFTHSSKGTGQV